MGVCCRPSGECDRHRPARRAPRPEPPGVRPPARGRPARAGPGARKIRGRPAPPRAGPGAGHPAAPAHHHQLPDQPGPLHLQRGQPDHRADGRRVPGREADPLGPRPEPAPGSPRRLLVQPLQRLHRGRVRPLQLHGVRAGGDPSLRARALPRPAGRRGRAPGHAVLPGQLHEPRRRDPGRPRHSRHQRELRARAARAAHRRRRRRLQPERRPGGGAGLHGVGDRQHQGRGELRLPRRPARPRGQKRLRLRRPGGRRQGGRRPAPRLPVLASGDRALHLLAAGPALRGRRPAGAHRRSHGVHVPLHRGRPRAR